MRSTFTEPLRRTDALDPAIAIQDEALLKSIKENNESRSTTHSAKVTPKQKAGVSAWISGFVIAAVMVNGALGKLQGPYEMSAYFHNPPEVTDIYDAYNPYDQAFARVNLAIPKEKQEHANALSDQINLVNSTIEKAQNQAKPTLSNPLLSEQENVRLNNALDVSLSQNQYDALAKLVATDGVNRVLRSQVMASINDADYLGAHEAIKHEPLVPQVFGVELDEPQLEKMLGAYRDMGKSQEMAATIKHQLLSYAKNASMNDSASVADLGKMVEQYASASAKMRQDQQNVMIGYKTAIRDLAIQAASSPSQDLQAQIQFMSKSHERVQQSYKFAQANDANIQNLVYDLRGLGNSLKGMEQAADPVEYQTHAQQARYFLEDIQHEMQVATHGAVHKQLLSESNLDALMTKVSAVPESTQSYIPSSRSNHG